MFQKQSGLTVHTEGSPWRLLLLFSLPLMAGNIFQQMYTVVDTAVVGRVLGVDALAALGTVDWLNWLTLGTIQGFTQGFSILMAQRFGAGDFDRLRKAAASAILLSALCGILLTAGSEAIAEPVTALLRVPAEIRPIAIDYLRVLFAGLPVVTAYNLAASMLRALGDGRTPLTAMVAASLTNIALDFWFVMGFRWGVRGAAAATIIAQCLAAGCCILRLCRVEALRLKKEDWAFDGPLWGLLMKLGLPMALHLDHGEDFAICKACIDGGFSSVMIDGSSLPFEENIKMAKQVVEYAHAHGVVVEAELGTLAGVEDEVCVSAEDSSYTRPEDVQEFVEKTGCDSLAIAIGTSHGAYKFKPGTKPQLRFDILEEVEKRLPGFPIVLHGSSSVPQDFVQKINAHGGKMPDAIGIPEEMLRQAAKMAVCKINIDSDIRLAITASIREYFDAHPDHFDPRQYLKPARQAVKDMVAHKIKNVLGSDGKA